MGARRRFTARCARPARAGTGAPSEPDRVTLRGFSARLAAPEGRDALTEPESHTLAYLRRIDEKLDRIEGRLERVEGRLDRIEDELLVLNGIVLRLEGREIETTG